MAQKTYIAASHVRKDLDFWNFGKEHQVQYHDFCVELLQYQLLS